LGFAACGFARADAADAAGLNLKRWLEAGHHGTMGWMEERAHHRVSPLALWPDARSAIALGMSYAPASDPLALGERPELGRISVYAQGGDYHKTVKKALKALARFIVEQAPSAASARANPHATKPSSAAFALIASSSLCPLCTLALYIGRGDYRRNFSAPASFAIGCVR